MKYVLNEVLGLGDPSQAPKRESGLESDSKCHQSVPTEDRNYA